MGIRRKHTIAWLHRQPKFAGVVECSFVLPLLIFYAHLGPYLSRTAWSYVPQLGLSGSGHHSHNIPGAQLVISLRYRWCSSHAKLRGRHVAPDRTVTADMLSN